MGACNVYTRTDLFRAQTDFACITVGQPSTSLGAPPSGGWPSRALAGPPDYLGVYIKYTHDLITGLFKGQKVRFTDFVVIRMEPR